MFYFFYILIVDTRICVREALCVRGRPVTADEDDGRHAQEPQTRPAAVQVAGARPPWRAMPQLAKDSGSAMRRLAVALVVVCSLVAGASAQTTMTTYYQVTGTPSGTTTPTTMGVNQGAFIIRP